MSDIRWKLDFANIPNELTTRSVVLCWAVSAATYLAAVLIYRGYFHPLADVPGPFLAKFTRAWQVYRVSQKTWHEDIVQLHDTYGPLVRIAYDEVAFVDNAATKALYGMGKSAAVKTRWYNTWKQFDMSNSFFHELDKGEHAATRRRVAHAYAMSSIIEMEPHIQEVLDENIRQFRKVAERGVSIDLDHWVTWFAYDVVTELAFGGAMGFLRQNKDVNGLIQAVYNGFYMITVLGHVPFQTSLLNTHFVQNLIQKYAPPALKAYPDFVTWSNQQITLRKSGENAATRNDLLQKFIESKNADGTPIGDGFLKVEMINVLGAGADTTSVGIRAIIGYLLMHPAQCAKARAEVDEAYSQCAGGELSYTELSKLPYLTAVIKEATRLLPSITHQMAREVPEGGVSIKGRFFPAGTQVSISAMTSNLDPEVFGSTAREFRPERWLEEPEETVKLMNSGLYTFGSGSRACVGRNIAQVELYKWTAQIFLRHFEFQAANAKQPYHVTSHWFATQEKFIVTLKQRKVAF